MNTEEHNLNIFNPNEQSYFDFNETSQEYSNEVDGDINNTGS